MHSDFPLSPEAPLKSQALYPVFERRLLLVPTAYPMTLALVLTLLLSGPPATHF